MGSFDRGNGRMRWRTRVMRVIKTNQDGSSCYNDSLYRSMPDKMCHQVGTVWVGTVTSSPSTYSLTPTQNLTIWRMCNECATKMILITLFDVLLYRIIPDEELVIIEVLEV